MKNSTSCEAIPRSFYEVLLRKDDELEQSRQAHQDLREGLAQALKAIGSQKERVKALEWLIDSQQEHTKTLERQQAKDSHTCSLPPSSDRFVRAPKSLRHKIGEQQKARGDRRHPRQKGFMLGD